MSPILKKNALKELKKALTQGRNETSKLGLISGLK
jgi:hypothetical protein